MPGGTRPTTNSKRWFRPRLRLSALLTVVAIVASALGLWIDEQRRAELRFRARQTAFRITGRQDTARRYRQQRLEHLQELAKARQLAATPPDARPKLSGIGLTAEESIADLTELVAWEEKMALMFDRAAAHPEELLPAGPSKPSNWHERLTSRIVRPAPPAVGASAPLTPAERFVVPFVVKKPQ